MIKYNNQGITKRLSHSNSESMTTPFHIETKLFVGQ